MGHKVDVINMDISEPFDCLNHELLIAKLKCYGLDQHAVFFLLEVTSQIDTSAVNKTIPLEIGEKL